MRQSNYILKDPHEKMFEFCLTYVKMFKTKDTERYAVHGVSESDMIEWLNNMVSSGEKIEDSDFVKGE